MVDTSESTRRGDALALLGICLGFLGVLVDATAVNVATGALAARLGASVVAVQWVLNAYTVAFAALMVTAGGIGDRWGARRTYLAGSLVFALGSAACAAAPTVGLLIAARAVQGTGAAAVVPCSLALIAHRYPHGRARSRALGAWGGVSGVGLALGPVCGGGLVGAFGWRSVFLVVVPVAAVSIVLVARRVGETPVRAARADPAGQVLVIVALVALTGALTQTSTAGWGAPSTVLLLAVAVLSGAGFVLVERRVREPMVPPALFAGARLRGAVGVGLLFNFGLYGVLFCLTLALERGLRLPGGLAGLALVPLTVVVAAAAVVSGRLTARTGPRVPMLLGLTGGLAGSCLLAGFGDRFGAVGLAVCGALVGLVGLAMPAMTGLALAAAGSRAALGAAVLNAARQAGGALGVALLGSAALGDPAAVSLRAPMLLAAAGYLVAILTTLTATRQQHRSPHAPPRTQR